MPTYTVSLSKGTSTRTITGSTENHDAVEVTSVAGQAPVTREYQGVITGVTISRWDDWTVDGVMSDSPMWFQFVHDNGDPYYNIEPVGADAQVTEWWHAGAETVTLRTGESVSDVYAEFANDWNYTIRRHLAIGEPGDVRPGDPIEPD